LVLPVGIAAPSSSASTNVFVADLVASGASDAGAPGADLGAIFIVSQSGGVASPISGTVGYQPRGVTIEGGPDAGDVLYFSGVDPTQTPPLPNVFSMAPSSAGAPAGIFGFGDLNDPSGVAVDSAGDVFVVDTDSTSGNGLSSIVEVSSTFGDQGTVVDGLTVGYPAGLAVTADGTTLYLSGRSTIDGSDIIITLDTATFTPTTSAPSGIGNYIEPAGLHLDLSTAGTVDFVDSLAGSSGAVFRVTP
jgi:hypothetical protein